MAATAVAASSGAQPTVLSLANFGSASFEGIVAAARSAAASDDHEIKIAAYFALMDAINNLGLDSTAPTVNVKDRSEKPGLTVKDQQRIRERDALRDQQRRDLAHINFRLGGDRAVYEAALNALAPHVKAASSVVPESAPVWEAAGLAAALLRAKALPKGGSRGPNKNKWKRVDNLVKNNITKFLPTKKLPKVGALHARAGAVAKEPERMGLVLADGASLDVLALGRDVDFDSLAATHDAAKGDDEVDDAVASIPTGAVDAQAALRREERRKLDRMRDVAAQDDDRPVADQQRALEEIPGSLVRQLGVISAKAPDEPAGFYIGGTIVPRGVLVDGFVGDELWAFFRRDNCPLVCARTGERLSMDQLRYLYAAGALEFAVSPADPIAALIDDCETTAQVAGRQLAAASNGLRVALYGACTYGGVGHMNEAALLYLSVIWFNRARAAGIAVRLGEVSQVTQRSLQSSVDASYLGRPRGDVANAFRLAMEALSSPAVAEASGAPTTCLMRPPPVGVERGWSCWGIACVGHHVFVVWFVEGSIIHCKRVNFCEGGDHLALAMYMRLRRVKLLDRRARLICDALPLDAGYVAGNLSTGDQVEVDEDVLDVLLDCDIEVTVPADAPGFGFKIDDLKDLYNAPLQHEEPAAVLGAADVLMMESLDAEASEENTASARKRLQAAAPQTPRKRARGGGRGASADIIGRFVGIAGLTTTTTSPLNSALLATKYPAPTGLELLGPQPIPPTPGADWDRLPK